MPSPTHSSTDNREPILSIEEFGHLIQSAFDSQTIRLGFQNQPPPPYPPLQPLPNHTRHFIPDSPSRKPSAKSLSAAFKWLGQSPNRTRPALPTAPSSQLSLASSSSPTRSPVHSDSDKTRQSPSGPRYAKSMFGMLKTKLSFERLPIRRQPSIPTTPLYHSITPSEPPPLPRPAPFFYSRSRSRILPLPDRTQNESSGPSSDISIDSDEIKSWRKYKPKKKSTKSLRELFRVGASSKAELPIQTPPPSRASPEPYSFLNMEPDPFASPPSPSPKIVPKYPHTNATTPGSPPSLFSSTPSDSVPSPKCTEGESYQQDSPYDLSLGTPYQSVIPPNVRILQEETSPNFLQFQPPMVSPIADPKKWIKDSESMKSTSPSSPLSPIPVSLAQEHVKALRKQDMPKIKRGAVKEPRASEESITRPASGNDIRTSLKKARSMPHSSQSNSASSHEPFQANSYHTATSSSPQSNAYSSGSASDSSQSLRMPGDLHLDAPPSSFKLSSPPRKRNPRLKEAQHSPKPEATIPGMWTSGSVSDCQITDPASLDKVLSSDSTLSTRLEQEDKSSMEGSFETAYTRPRRKRRSHAIDFGKPTVPVPDLPTKEVSTVLPSQETILANLDSFVKAHTPIAWPLPPKLTVLIDPKTGERWKNVSPVSEYHGRGSAPLDPTSRHAIRYRTLSSGASIPSSRCQSNACSKSSGDKSPQTTPALSCSVSVNSSIQAGVFKPLPPRPGSNNSCDSKNGNSSIGCASRKSARTSRSGTGSKHSNTSPRRPTSVPLVRIYFGGEELVINTDNPAEIPTTFILCPREEDELRFESHTWAQLHTFCQNFKEIIIRADLNAVVSTSVPRRELHVAIMEYRKRLILSMSLHDIIMIARDIKPIMKIRLTLPTSLGKVVEECDQIPIGLYV